MIARLRSISCRRALTWLFAVALLLAACFAAASGSRESRVYAPVAVEQAIASEGARLVPLPPADTEPKIRAVTPRRYLIGAVPNDSAQRETIAIYAFPTEAERLKGEAELSASLAASGGLPPALFGRGNILILYRPLAIINQTGTQYGDLLRSALASL
ncbi:hypothetical protein SD70_20995 [Gordoniibacillus kamchatkensis]|uniref:Lipoprotein n=1 Tax=Gordoniibacillus kamchatkensis TaxID=1590651 RepID=A0ABR5AFD2_9BACL|nr:hypothetical protein [Paenibacillus sp. VKM B-2647]KIL39280.1 hypothetical protein SD70_20995 [Paenibacillus sp. VKM B-2647]